MQHDFLRQRIRTLREQQGITNKEMADKLGMDERNYMRIENGEKKLLDIELLDTIAKALNKDMSQLLYPDGIVIENNSFTENNVGANINLAEQHLTFAEDKELKNSYTLVIQELRAVIEDQRRIIEHLKSAPNGK